MSLWLLTFLFSLRVIGQAVQRYVPQSWLPPFDAWQGSSLDYPWLLSAQVVILGAMAWFSTRAWTGALRPSLRVMQWLTILGTLYMVASVVRIGIGLGVPSAPAWFRAWISGVFHVVLAAFALAGAHTTPSRFVPPVPRARAGSSDMSGIRCSSRAPSRPSPPCSPRA